MLDIPSGQPQPDAFGDADAVLAVVERTLAAMKPELAEVFVLRTARHVSFRDIAEQQGVSINTALGRMHQAVAKLHAALTTHDLLPGGLR